jgi:hypothetical protein
VEDPANAKRVAKALVAENVGAIMPYEADRFDLHVYAHWVPIINQRTWTPSGGPWVWAQREIKYRVDECPRTSDLLGRAVHLDVSPLLTIEDVEETVGGVKKVLNALL